MKTIKSLLNEDGLKIACGASNAMIAKLVENAGFDAVWVSSFEMHAWNRLPDASIRILSVSLVLKTIGPLSAFTNCASSPS